MLLDNMSRLKRERSNSSRPNKGHKKPRLSGFSSTKDDEDLFESESVGSDSGDTREDGEYSMSELPPLTRALYLIQTGRVHEADHLIAELGCTHRLAECILRYDLPNQSTNESQATSPSSHNQSGRGAHRKYMFACDEALPPEMLQVMKSAFSSKDSVFWEAHSYSVSPPSPYFSYVHDLSQKSAHGLDDVVRHAQRVAAKGFPNVMNATFAEWWVHCRPHNSGHQFHFDSADEGRGGVRNPIASTVLYLEAACGGPTCVTDQKFGEPKLGEEGWLAHPKENRFVAFDGRVLHGVVPGRGFQMLLSARRVTFMVAFWEHDVRQEHNSGDPPGSAMPLPLEAEWMQPLLPRLSSDKNPIVREVEPHRLPRVWERVGKAGKGLGSRMPSYSQCFQGF